MVYKMLYVQAWVDVLLARLKQFTKCDLYAVFLVSPESASTLTEINS